MTMFIRSVLGRALNGTLGSVLVFFASAVIPIMAAESVLNMVIMR